DRHAQREHHVARDRIAVGPDCHPHRGADHVDEGDRHKELPAERHHLIDSHRGNVPRTHIEVKTRNRTLTLKLKSWSTFITTGLELRPGACHPPRYRVVMSAPAMNMLPHSAKKKSR